MNDSPDHSADDERNPVDVLAEEFVARLRRARTGVDDNPTIAEYCEDYPDHADEIAAIFPTLEMMESLKPESATNSSGGPIAGGLDVEQFGDFRLRREIGRGGMGVVYEAVQESLDRRVALKVLPSSAVFSPNTVERFHREARAAAKLHHTNIVPVYGVGEVNGTQYFVMQYIEGRGLDVVLHELRSAKTPATELPEFKGLDLFTAIARIGEQVADALAHAHTHGTLHRDIKPSNLIVAPDGNVWVADFGLAKLDELEDLTHSGSLLGTLRYTAPEQLDGVTTAASDVYALGVTLYELLTLKPAFGETDRRQLLHRIAHDTPARPRTLRASIPLDLETVVLTAMAREPGQRYPDAAAFAADLRRFIDGQPVVARRIGPAERFARWCRRNRAFATATFAAAASLIIAATVGWIGYATTTASLQRESENVELSLGALEEIFDSLAGDHDPDGPRPLGPPGRENPAAAARETEILTRLLDFHDRFAAKNETNPALRRDAARAYRRVSQLHARRDDTDAAVAAGTRSVELFEQYLREVPDDLESHLEAAGAHCELGAVGENWGAHFDRALELARARESDADPARARRARNTIAQTYLTRGRRTAAAGDHEAAEMDLERAIAGYEESGARKAARPNADRTPPRRIQPHALEAHLELAKIEIARDELDAAIARLERVTKDRAAARGRSRGFRELMVRVHRQLAAAFEAKGDPRSAEEQRRLGDRLERAPSRRQPGAERRDRPEGDRPPRRRPRS